MQVGGGVAGRVGITGVYVKATLEEVAKALAALTGEPHPLAVQASDEETAPL